MKNLPAVELRLASEEDGSDLRRMYARQTRILHGFDASIVPDQVLQSDWWQKPDDLFAYMIDRAGAPVGFCLVMGARYVAAVDEEGDYLIWEMFVDEPHRGGGIAESAVREIFSRQPGRWSVKAIPKNERAVGFWRRVTLRPPLNGTEQQSAEGFTTFRFVAP